MRRSLLLGAVGFLLVAGSAHATIVTGEVTGGQAQTGGGVFVKLVPPLSNPFGPPNSVGDNNFQSLNLFGFDEDQNIVLATPLDVDVGSSPIPTGTTVASHYIFFDPGPTRTLVGTVEFDSDVLAIITSTDNLDASDFLANTGVNYLNPGLRGLESGDSVTISGLRQITFDVSAGSPGDYVRVLTAFSPAGDFNEDGNVDAADYVKWRKHNGTSDPLPNDGGLGVPIGVGHFNLWRGSFGGSLNGSGSSANAAEILIAVPEPTSAMLASLLLPMCASVWYRKPRGYTSLGQTGRSSFSFAQR